MKYPNINFIIRYGSEKQKDDIINRHADHLHLFSNQFERSVSHTTDEQMNKVKESASSFFSFSNSKKNSGYDIAQTTDFPDLHDYFAKSRHFHENLAANPHISSSHIDQILDDRSVHAHEIVAARKDLTPEHIDILHKHPDPDVRDALIDNHRDKLSPEQLKTAKHVGYLPKNDI